MQEKNSLLEISWYSAKTKSVFNENATDNRIKFPAGLLFKHGNLISHSIFDNARKEIEKISKSFLTLNY